MPPRIYEGECPDHEQPKRGCPHCDAQMRRSEHHGVPVYPLHWPAPEVSHG